MLRSWALALALTVLTAAPAAASTARVTAAGHIVVQAGPGERNRVVVAPAALGATLISDAAGVVPAGPECTALSPTAAQCPGQGEVDATLGDRDDVFDAGAETAPVHVTGGPGRDTITGGAGNDELAGDLDRRGDRGGADRLSGGGGDDALEGGPGDDVIAGGAGDDVTAGDQGRDTEDGGAGDDELDVLALQGDPVVAAAGPDTLRGGAGRDELDAPSRGDRALAGPGDDDVVAVAARGQGDAARQVVDCGPGRDTVEVGSDDDLTACERPIFTRECSPGPRCTLRWVATAGRRVVARGATSRVLGLLLTARIALDATGRRLARRPGGVTIGVSVQLRSGRTSFAPEPAIRGLRLRDGDIG